jgi:hypothetical protein
MMILNEIIVLIDHPEYFYQMSLKKPGRFDKDYKQVEAVSTL